MRRVEGSYEITSQISFRERERENIESVLEEKEERLES